MSDSEPVSPRGPQSAAPRHDIGPDLYKQYVRERAQRLRGASPALPEDKVEEEEVMWSSCCYHTRLTSSLPQAAPAAAAVEAGEGDQGEGPALFREYAQDAKEHGRAVHVRHRFDIEEPEEPEEGAPTDFMAALRATTTAARLMNRAKKRTEGEDGDVLDVTREVLGDSSAAPKVTP